ncbi:IS66 family insertion sequence element accessory protein TnpB [Chitinophaga filiformis]|uniref:IS66 family insertion sequence element accessory protein TnpB n=1 Tax=Chitinophaga filiformis TaxID=104663 RepID=UPI00397DF7BE
MLHISSSNRYLLCSEPTDMRKSFHGLAAMVKYCMDGDVLNGDICIFVSKRRNAIKLLSFEGDGFVSPRATASSLNHRK